MYSQLPDAEAISLNIERQLLITTKQVYLARTKNNSGIQ
jgi:hypothetical protein